MAVPKAHTIILSQATSAEASRTFTDHPTVSDAIESVCEMFEREMKERVPDKRELTYDIKDLHLFIDRLEDLSALVYENSKKAYVPCNRDWIKKKCFQHLHKATDRDQ